MQGRRHHAADHAIRGDGRHDCSAERIQTEEFKDSGDLQCGGIQDRPRVLRHSLHPRSAGHITLLITQSGETADTIAAQRESRQKSSKTLAICNVVGSMIARESSGTVYTHAGPEIGVASTKAFTAQLTALVLLALHLAEVRGTVTKDQGKKLIAELLKIPGKLETVLGHDEAIEDLAKRYSKSQDFLFLGRGIHYPIALEGALK